MPQTDVAKPILDDRARGVGLEGIPALAAMLLIARWITWFWKPIRRKDGSIAGWTKAPRIAGTRSAARVNQLAHGRSYEEARASVLRGEADGVGWLLLGDTDRVWLDYDKCRDPVTGVLAPWALAVLAMAPGAYWEVTPSGTGIRVMGKANLDFPLRGKVQMGQLLAGQDEEGLEAWGGSRECHERAAIEIFHARAHYMTVSGWDGTGDSGVDVGGVAIELWLLGTAQAPETRGAAGGLRMKPAVVDDGVDRTAPIEDVLSALFEIPNENEHWDQWALVGQGVFGATRGSAEGFEAWVGWSEKCGKHDLGQCEERWGHWRKSPTPMIGFGTLDRLAKAASPDWKRWSRQTADEFDVVAEAEEGSRPAARGKLATPEANDAGDVGDAGGPGAAAAFQILAARLIYVTRQHRWRDTLTGLLLDEPRLRLLAEKNGVKGAQGRGAKALVARLARPGSGMRQALSLTMRPGQGELVDEGGQPHANTWTPSKIVPLAGATAADAGPWLEHARRLIPNDADRERVLDRLAWALQNPGKKVNSALVLLGEQETGKDTLLQAFWMAVGPHNRALVEGSNLGGSFNSYLELPWVLISEMPPAHKRDVYENLKSMLTAPPDHIRINRKGIEEYEIPNVVNVIITTNHIAAIALAESDRRFDVIATVAAVVGEAMAAYYKTLHGWYQSGGYEAVAGYLLARDVSAFNPHRRPPVTVAKQAMARGGAHPAVDWVMSLWDADGPLAGSKLVTVSEILAQGKAGRWEADNVVMRGINRQWVLQALRMGGWAVLPQQIRDGDGKPFVWMRGLAWDLMAQLKPVDLARHLQKDRAKRLEFDKEKDPAAAGGEEKDDPEESP